MARRNVWTTEETRELLTIIKDLDLMKMFGEERNTKLYQIAEDELKHRGFFYKDAFQIEHKWKNLKRTYHKTKRENYLTESCEFYEELDELMAMKPTTATSKARGEGSDRPKRPRVVLENFDLLLTKLAKVERENNDEFFKKQKDLVDYEFDLYTHDERQYTAKVSQMLNRNMNDFCAKASQILLQEGIVEKIVEEVEDAPNMEDPKDGEQELAPIEQIMVMAQQPVVKQEIVKEFYQTWREEEPF